MSLAYYIKESQLSETLKCKQIAFKSKKRKLTIHVAFTSTNAYYKDTVKQTTVYVLIVFLLDYILEVRDNIVITIRVC